MRVNVKNLLLLVSLIGSALAVNAGQITLRVADQKGNMRAQLEAANKLDNLPYKIEWSEFPAAAPLAEALKALASAGLSAKDVTFRFLPPSDAKLALTQGSVDVWATWEPYTAFAETQDHLRVLVNGRGLWSGNSFLAATDTALKDKAKREAIADYLQRLSDAQVWAYKNLDAYSEKLAKIIGFPLDAAKLGFERRKSYWQPIDAATETQQQQTADFYHAQGLLPVALNVTGTFDHSFLLK